MGKYDIKDAVMLKECMKQIAAVKAKYPSLDIWLGESMQDDLKHAIELIQAMVEKDV